MAAAASAAAGSSNLADASTSSSSSSFAALRQLVHAIDEGQVGERELAVRKGEERRCGPAPDTPSAAWIAAQVIVEVRMRDGGAGHGSAPRSSSGATDVTAGFMKIRAYNGVVDVPSGSRCVPVSMSW